MQKYATTQRLVEALKAESFTLPDHCHEARLIMPAHGPLMVQYDVFLTADDTARLGRALARLADDKPD